MDKFYTLWKQHGKSIVLMEDEPTFLTKGAAFKRAKVLRKDLIYGTNDAIIVRHITVGKRECTQWVFEPTA